MLWRRLKSRLSYKNKQDKTLFIHPSSLLTGLFLEVDNIGNRAILVLHEAGQNSYFTAYHGANSLSPLLRLAQAKEWQTKLPEWQTIAHIFEHLDYDGKYQPVRLADEDMFFTRVAPQDITRHMKSYEQHSLYEMRFLLDLDENFIQMEYNPNCPWYRTMGVFSIDLDAGLENVEKLLTHAEERGITDFGRLLAIYQNSTGLAEKLDAARANMEVDKYLTSPQAQEDRERYFRLFGRPEELEVGESDEEMEEQ